MKVVVVHRGARDSYQAALAMEEAGLLDRLITDFYWPESRWPALPGRSNPELPVHKTESLYGIGLTSILAEKSHMNSDWKRRLIRRTDAVLGKVAGEWATRSGTSLLSYSYYAHAAFSAYKGCGQRLLFQLHPHPASVRRILQRELERFPECSVSLRREWELSLPPEEFRQLEEEPQMADRCVVASSFTKSTLVENGVNPSSIDVVPYGVDLNRFRPSSARKDADRVCGPLCLLFVGTINQRKGIKYLAETMARFHPNEVQLRICGRVVDGLELLKPLQDRIQVTPQVSNAELVAAYQDADLFVLPSVAEGFGQVLLESLACGLPILSTTRTAAPDLIDDGEQGFIVDPGNVDQLASRISWALENREELCSMRRAARSRAEQFPWSEFRSKLAAFVHIPALRLARVVGHV